MAKNILNIDDHYLRYPKDQWGGTDLNNPDMINPWFEIQEIVNPKKVIEIGMWAGHGSLVMMNVFKNLESLVSYDPHPVSKMNARQIKKYYPQHTYYEQAIYGNEHRHHDIDLIFVDGDHTHPQPSRDMKSVSIIKPRYVLFDNMEHIAVRLTTKLEYKLWDVKYNPRYYFYTNEKYSQATQQVLRSPGIMGLFKLEGNYDNI